MNHEDKHISEEDLALFALALMPPQEAAYTLAHLKHCDSCRGTVATMQGDLVTYAMTSEMHEPSPAARERFLAAVAKEKKFMAPPQPAPVEPVLAPRSTNLLDREVREMPQPKRGPNVLTWAGWAVAASALLFAGWEMHQQGVLQDQLQAQAGTLQQANGDAARAQRVLQALTDPTAMQVSLHLPATGTTPPKPEGHASYNPLKGELVFIGTHLQAVDPDKTYQLWLLPASGEAPVPAGLFKPDANGNASVVLPELPKHVAAKGFGVTVEAEGGASKPTPPIVLAGM